MGYLAEEMSKQNVEGAAWIIMTAGSKMWEESDELRKKLLSKKIPEVKDVENSQHIAKNEKGCFENTKGGIGLSLDEEIMGTYKQKNCQLWTEGLGDGQNEGRLLDFLHFKRTRQQSYLAVNMCHPSKRRTSHPKVNQRSVRLPLSPYAYGAALVPAGWRGWGPIWFGVPVCH